MGILRSKSRYLGCCALPVAVSCAGHSGQANEVVQKSSEPQVVRERTAPAASPRGPSGEASPGVQPDPLKSGGASAPEPPSRFPHSAFPPPDPGPAFERSAHAGDGIWSPFFSGEVSDKKGARTFLPVPVGFASEVMRRMVIHPHEASRFQSLTLAAFDLQALRVGHRPGKQDVQDVGRSDLEAQAGRVPVEEQGALLAVFNGGFQPRHGRWGMLTMGEQLVAARHDACTVAVLKDGTVRIGPWSELEKELETIVSYRQTPPCLVTGGEVHNKLKKKNRKAWAGQHADRKTRRRSAVGVSRDGRTLMFGVGGETEPEVLAHGLRHAGAHYAAQLDINWNWTRLFVFKEEDTAVRPVGALIEHMAKDKGEYLSRAGARGFFYVSRREESQ